MVHLWTQQETGKNTSDVILYHSCLKYASCILPDHVFIFQPFCDGAHKTKAQGLSPLRFVPEKDTTVWLCGCKYTNNPPYCDGTHKQDFIKSAPLHDPTDSWKDISVNVSVASTFLCVSALDESGTCKLIDRDNCLNLESCQYFSQCLTEESGDGKVNTSASFVCLIWET